MSTRTDKLKQLVQVSEAVDHYRSLLRISKKSYNNGLKSGLTLPIHLESIDKYNRVIRILELKFKRLSNEN